MNFNGEILSFQGAIISADNENQFSRLSAKGGNEEEIQNVIDNLESFLKRRQYLDDAGIVKEKESQFRDFAMYLVLNSEFILEEMFELDGIATFIGTIVPIPKCLLCELMWNLHMERFIHEIISYSYPQLSMAVADAFITNFKYFSPVDGLKQLRLLTSATYVAISRLSLYDTESELTQLAMAAKINFQKCVQYYVDPPNSHKLNKLSKYELYKYLGRRVYSLFLVIKECFTIFTGKQSNALNIEFYEITYPENSLKTISDEPICDVRNSVLIDLFNDCHTILLDQCKELVMVVSVDVFCCWSEVDENGESMQQTIGELCYKVRNQLLSIPVLCDHPLVSMMEPIARKPAEMKDIINAADNETILGNINKNDSESKKWIQAILLKDQVYKNIELLKVIELNLDKYEEEERRKLYLVLNKHGNQSLEHENFINTLCMKLFQKFNLATKYEIIDEHFSNNNLFNVQETTDFTNTMTEIFNKFIATQETDLTDVLTVFLQNPQEVYIKIFDLAAENNQQTSIMLKVIKLIEKYVDYYYGNETEPCIFKIMQVIIDSHLDTEVKQNNFIRFLCELKAANIISGSKLLLLIVMTNLHKSLLSKDVERIHLQVRLLKDAYTLEELKEYRAPMLAMMAQVLNMVRWKINSFTAVAPVALESTLELQKSIFATYNGSISEKEKSWLKSKLTKMQPLNLFYYKSLWVTQGSNYLETVSGKKIERTSNTHELISLLSQIISSCTQQEWCSIWDSLQIVDGGTILKIFHDALATLIVAEKANRTEQSWNCLMYCMRNFVYVIRYKYLKENLISIEKAKNVVSNIASLGNYFEENVEDFEVIMMPLVAYLSEKRSDCTVDISEFLNNYMKTSGASVIKKIFSNFVK